MGLSPALVDYAENIWRRFPEAFIALGLPQLEDLFELNEGSWCYRVVDTRAEKVVEIVLPRRQRRDPEDECSEDEEANRSSWPTGAEAAPARQESPAQGSRTRMALGSQVAAKVNKFGLDVANLQRSIKDHVSREIQAQLRDVKPLNPRARAGHQVPSAALFEARCDSFASYPGNYTGARAAQEEGEGSKETISPTESVVSWTSSLAARRGVNIGNIDVSVVPKKDRGPGSVKRCHLLDRTFERSDNPSDGRLKQDRDFRKGDKVRVTSEGFARGMLGVVLEPRWYGHVQVALEEDDCKGQVKTFRNEEIQLVEALEAESVALELSEASSPGAELQRAARRRRGANNRTEVTVK